MFLGKSGRNRASGYTSGRAGPNLLHERVEVLELNCDLSEAAIVRTIDILGENKILAVRVLTSENSQVGSVEVCSGPLALDCDRRIPPRGQDEVNLVSPFVTPIRDLAVLSVGHDLVEHEMLPKPTKILAAQVLRSYTTKPVSNP